MSPDYPLKLATLRVVRFLYVLLLLQVAFLHYQGEMIRYIGDFLFSFQSLPSYVHLWIASTVEQLLVLLSLLLNAYVCILFVKTWNWPHQQQKVDDEVLATIQKFITENSKVNQVVSSLNHGHASCSDLLGWWLVIMIGMNQIFSIVLIHI